MGVRSALVGRLAYAPRPQEVDRGRVMDGLEDTDIAAAAARRRRRRPALAGVAAGLLGLLLTAVLTAAFNADTAADVDAELGRMAMDVDTKVNRRVEVAESALLTMAAQVSTGTADSQEIQWVLANTAVVEELPGMLAMLYAEATMTEDGLRVAPRAIHPLGPNVGALGRNILQDPERRRAVEAARDSGRTSATSIVTHVDGGVDALQVMVPVFTGTPENISDRRDAFRGVMIAVVSPTDLFADIARLPAELVVEDLGPTGVVPDPALPLTLVWHSGATPEGTVQTHEFRLADRTWRLTIAPGAGFPVTSNAADVVAASGALLSVLLGLLAVVLVGRRERLEQLVADRTRELRCANDDLERAGRLRSQFISTVSHELRTPLTSVLGFVQTVRRAGIDDATRDELLARAERNGLTLRRMIEELLDFGRLERGDIVLNRRPMAIDRAVTQIVRDLEASLECRVELDLAADARAAVDGDALERIVTNLLTNARRYAGDAGPVEVVVRREGHWVELVCRDRGPGFADGDVSTLFERFVRGSGVMGEGTGIGLSVVRDLAVAHGGSASLGNRPGGGAEVVVRLPAMTVEYEAVEVAVGRPLDSVLSDLD